jgi:hypothetical protein
LQIKNPASGLRVGFYSGVRRTCLKNMNLEARFISLLTDSKTMGATHFTFQ